MILLFGVFLLFSPTNTKPGKSFRSHVADNLKLKCESLPYRSVYDDNRCYFVVLRKVVYADAARECSSTLQGAKVALEAPSIALAALMVDQSLFHTDTGASNVKYTLCVRDVSYTCGKGQTMIRGKCIGRADKRMSFADAQKNCKKAGLELFSPDNDFDNQIIMREVKDTAWVQKSLVNRGSKFVWSQERSYTRFTPCDGKTKKLYAGSQTGCSAPLATVVEKTGYWSTTDPKTELDVICTKNAGNELTPVVVVKKPIVEEEGPCVEQHEIDESTGKCEWTGPIDACAALLDYWNEPFYVRMPEFPMFPHVEVDLRKHAINEYAVKVVVRKGCMFTGYKYPLDGNGYQEIKVAENLLYGAHKLGNYVTQDAEYPTYLEGLTRANCWCDPTEATVSGHVPAPPPSKKCIQHHKFNETTQQCEWIHDPKFCGELITHDNRMMRLEIPNWPSKRKYDVDHYNYQNHLNFHVQVTQIIVRQHCFATIYWHALHDWKTLPTIGYGVHPVASFLANPPLANVYWKIGSARFVCECVK